MIVIINDEIVMFGFIIELESVFRQVELNIFEGWQILNDSVFIKTHNARVKSIIGFILDFEFIVLFLRILKGLFKFWWNILEKTYLILTDCTTD